jgi:hypothetical protein
LGRFFWGGQFGEFSKIRFWMGVLTTTASVFPYLIGVVFDANVAFAFFGLFPNGQGMVAAKERVEASRTSLYSVLKPSPGEDVGL